MIVGFLLEISHMIFFNLDVFLRFGRWFACFGVLCEIHRFCDFRGGSRFSAYYFGIIWLFFDFLRVHEWNSECCTILKYGLKMFGHCCNLKTSGRFCDYSRLLINPNLHALLYSAPLAQPSRWEETPTNFPLKLQYCSVFRFKNYILLRGTMPSVAVQDWKYG